MDNFRALPKLSEKLEEMVANGQARLATVVAVYLNEVDAQLSDGSIARFPTTHNGLKVGQRGVLIAATGGSKIFTPLGLQVPFSKTAGAYQTITRTTAGESYITNAELVLDGLIPSKTYDMTLSIVVKIHGGGQGRIGWGWHTGGSWSWGGSDTFSFPSAGDLRSMTLGGSRPADSNGEIRLALGIKWISGTVTATWGYITAQVNS